MSPMTSGSRLTVSVPGAPRARWWAVTCSTSTARSGRTMRSSAPPAGDEPTDHQRAGARLMSSEWAARTATWWRAASSSSTAQPSPTMSGSRLTVFGRGAPQARCWAATCCTPTARTTWSSVQPAAEEPMARRRAGASSRAEPKIPKWWSSVNRQLRWSRFCQRRHQRRLRDSKKHGDTTIDRWSCRINPNPD